mgnify:CR=1 FL=1
MKSKSISKKSKHKQRTIHELANTLIEIAKILKTLPDVEVSKLMKLAKEESKKEERRIRKKLINQLIRDLDEGKDIDKLKETLDNLTMYELRYLSKRLNIPFEKRKKAEIVRFILDATVRSRKGLAKLERFGRRE